MNPDRVPARFDPADLRHVQTLDDIRALAPDADGVLVHALTDAKLAAIAEQVPGLRHLMTDGRAQVTDGGLQAIRLLNRLESLDLEWSRVTDGGLPLIAAASSLRWVDLGFCEGVSAHGLAELRGIRPDLEVVDTA